MTPDEGATSRAREQEAAGRLREDENVKRLLAWRLRAVVRRSGLPDLPETRTLLRLSYWNGFTGGALATRVASARAAALAAVAAYSSGHREDGAVR